MKPQNIVVKNEFTNTHFSRGKTPSSFVKNYTARDDATLTSYPVTGLTTPNIMPLDENSAFLKRSTYLKNQTKRLNQIADASWEATTHLEGRVFTPDSLSASRELLEYSADSIQTAFDQDHTVFKLVVSFDLDYLKRINVLDPDYQTQGNEKTLMEMTDDMKLRYALQHGFNDLSDYLKYKDPMFIGSVQLDRDHPHAHVVLVDQADDSPSKKWYDGFEYGKLNTKERQFLRESVDLELNANKSIAIMPSTAVMETEKVLKTYGKTYADADLKRNIMMIKANPKEELLQTKLFQQVTSDVVSRKPTIDPNQFQTNLQKNLNEAKDLKPLPEIVNLQMQSISSLKKKDTTTSRMMARVKESKEVKVQAQEKQREAFDRLLFLNNMYHIINTRIKDLGRVIKDKIEPFYINRVVANSYVVDKANSSLYLPVKEILTPDKEFINDLTIRKETARTNLDRASVNDQLKENILRLHQQDNITASDVATVLRAKETEPFIPKLKESGRMDSEYRKQVRAIDENQIKKVDQAFAKDAAVGLSYFKDDDRFENLISQFEYEQEIQSLSSPTTSIHVSTSAAKEEFVDYKSVPYDTTEDIILQSVQDTQAEELY